MRTRLLVPLEIMAGAAGLTGGLLLALAPDGSLLQADPTVLTRTPFPDWRWPGVLLAVLVGGGFLISGGWQWHGGRHARELSMTAGAGLVLFEVAEMGWIGFQPLQALFTLVGLVIIFLSWGDKHEHRNCRTPGHQLTG